MAERFALQQAGLLKEAIVMVVELGRDAVKSRALSAWQALHSRAKLCLPEPAAAAYRVGRPEVAGVEPVDHQHRSISADMALFCRWRPPE